MSTSAKALYDLLQPTLSTKSNVTLAKALATQLGLKGKVAQHTAIHRTMDLVERVKSDIRESIFDDTARSALDAMFRSVKALETYSFYSEGPAALSQKIGGDALHKLYNIHLALDGKAQRYDDPLVLGSIAEELSQLKERILSSDLPNELKSVLEQRISDLESAVSHYRVWGHEGLRDAIALLVGDAVLFGGNAKTEDAKGIWKSIVSVASKGANFLGAAAKASRDVDTLVDEGAKAAEFLRGLSDQNLLGGG